MDEKVLKMWAFVKCSPNRISILKALNQDVPKTPTDLSKETGMRPQNVSNYLIPLNEKRIVKCINDEMTKPRYYTLTKTGKEIIDNL